MPKQSRVGGAASLMAAQAILLILGYVTHVWIGRVLGPGAYGVYGVALSIQTIIGIWLAQGVPMAVSRFVARDPEHAGQILARSLWLQIQVAALISLATALAAPLIAHMLKDASLINLIRFIAIIFLLQAIYPVYIQFFSGLARFNRQAVLTAFYAVVKLAAALTFAIYFGVFGAIAGFGIGGLAAAILGWYWTRHFSADRKYPLPIKSFASFAGTYVLILVCLQILISLDLLMVKSFIKDNTQTGYYNAAVTLSRISFLLLQSLSFVLLPSVSALTKPGASHENAIIFIRATLRYLIMLIIPGTGLAAATSENLILLFFSREYLAAAPALTVLMIGLGALAFYLLLINIVAGAGRARTGLIFTVILLGVSLALGWWLIPRYGILGAAWQTTITGIIGLLALTCYTLRVFAITLPIRSLINVIAATAVAVFPTYFWPVSPLFLPLQYLLLLSLYAASLVLLKEFTPQDIKIVYSLSPWRKRVTI